MKVAVEQLRAGDVLTLPSGRPVTVERVDEYEGGAMIVRWWRIAGRGEPGYERGATMLAQRSGVPRSGRYLGSLAPCARGTLVEIRERSGWA